MRAAESIIAEDLLIAPDAAVGSDKPGINSLYLADETETVEALVKIAALDSDASRRVEKRAAALVRAVRENRERKGGLDAFLMEYDLASQEGVVLMCLAEALLRIPDQTTADRLIRDKLADADWGQHLGDDQPLFVNASTWGLMLTGRIIGPPAGAGESMRSVMSRMVARAGEPVIRAALRQAMKIMGFQYVMGRDIGEAMKRSREKENRPYRYSFDMLGEAALTAADAARYLDAYATAITEVGRLAGKSDVFAAPSISVKLSALHPRYEFAQRARVMTELVPRVARLAKLARDADIALTVDAEEARRLDVSLDVFRAVYEDRALGDWAGFGLAVQAYQKRAIAVVDWVVQLARTTRRRIPLRLVKGAYWDTEIKFAQEQGHSSYPVFTRKISTDVSYLACAKRLLAASDAVYPQFATHNARTLAAVVEMAGVDTGAKPELEFQRLHGMGEELYEEVVGKDKLGIACRVYAPVGAHKDLLPYLVRRLLENGANTSFVNRISDESVPIGEIIADPVAAVNELKAKPHPKIPSPADMYQPDRVNSSGMNLFDPDELVSLRQGIQRALEKKQNAVPVINGRQTGGEKSAVSDPANRERTIGTKTAATTADVDAAIAASVAGQPSWDRRPARERREILDRAAALFEKNGGELIALCVREAGKSIPDSVSELREAVDFLRYYGHRAEVDFGAPVHLPGPTGESNELQLEGRGVFVAISPWNFPLAIFTGQVSAALAAGNAVLAKPAEQTSLIGSRAIELLLEAGVPADVLHFIPGRGSVIGAHAIKDPRIAGVVFTGSTETARVINRSLADRDAPIGTLIAETGGQNAMIVDSSALPEQVVIDAVQSSFNSAGQRCSALRVMFLQDEIADRIIELLAGHMAELKIGDPALLATDVGPVIDTASCETLTKHLEYLGGFGRIIYQCPLGESTRNGTFFGPAAVEIDRLDRIEREVFGPILHIIRYQAQELDAVIDAINGTGYGLTLGVHSRIDSIARYIQRRVSVGNAYINRNMIGAVVGVQPFGGCGLSGTGPKAGGPHYLHRFANERTLTINTAAVGGNATLLSLTPDD